MDYTYHKDFKYSHDNPYHDRLKEFSDFVLRDSESEEFQGRWNKDVFKRVAPLYLEIGTGYGQFMREFCQNNPIINFVGLDYRFKRSYELAKKLNNLNLDETNFRYLRAKGERLRYLFDNDELDRIYYFFPDPWPKKRHHKKRLFQGPFLEAAYQVLRPGGQLFIKTDHDDYAKWMSERLKDNELFAIEMESKDLGVDYPDHQLSKYKTKFEKIFIQQGIPIKAFVLTSKKRVH